MIDLLIAGIIRSGTTALAALLHAPPKQVVLIEQRPFREKVQREIATLQEADTKVACKEVNSFSIKKVVACCCPLHTILVVRDPYSIAMSAFDWSQRGHPSGMTADDMQSWILAGAETLLEFPSTTLVLRYEEFAAKPTIAEELFRDLGWDMQQEIHIGPEWRYRSDEVLRHRGRLSSASLRRWEEKCSDASQRFANQLLSESVIQQYTSRFCAKQ